MKLVSGLAGGALRKEPPQLLGLHHPLDAQGAEGRLASLRSELLPPLPPCGPARRPGRHVHKSCRRSLRRALLRPALNTRKWRPPAVPERPGRQERGGHDTFGKPSTGARYLRSAGVHEGRPNERKWRVRRVWPSTAICSIGHVRRADRSANVRPNLTDSAVILVCVAFDRPQSDRPVSEITCIIVIRSGIQRIRRRRGHPQ